MMILFLVGCAGMNPPEMNLDAKGRYGENRQYLEETIGDNADAPFLSRYFLCNAYVKLKSFGEAFTCIDVLEQRVKADDYKIYWFDYSYAPNLLRAEAYVSLGDYDNAIKEARKAYDIALTHDLSNPDCDLKSLAYLGLAQALSGQVEEARKTADMLRDVYTGYPYGLFEDLKTAGLAKIYVAIGDFQKAYDVAKKGTSDTFTKGIANALMGGENYFVPQELDLLYIQNKSLLKLGRYDEAQVGYESLMELPVLKETGEIYWNILYDVGVIYEHEGRFDEASAKFMEAVDVIEAQRSSIASEANKIGFVGDKQAVYNSLISLLLFEGRDVEAFEYVERAKSRSLVDLLAKRNDFSNKLEVDFDSAQMLRQLKIAEARYIQLDETQTMAQREDQRRGITNLRQSISEKTPELASLVSVTTLTAKEIQDRLGDDEGLLEYYQQGDSLVAFWVTKDGVKGGRLNAEGLEADIGELRRLLADPNDTGYIAQAQKLHDRLIKPLGGLHGKKELTVVAHGPMHYLPFSALYDGSRYLVDKATIRMLPSASVMQFLKDTGETGEMLILGNPDLGDPRFDLPGAETEARMIKDIHPGSTVLLRESASETNMKNAGTHFSVIHIAAHGEFNQENPLQSRLLLTPDKQNDGYLSAGEMYGIRIDADLVTLSACDTGLGKTAAGDDVIGLSRGFLYAGANTLVTTLWPVSDEETAFLMVEFYRNLKTMPKAEALRQAQFALRDRNPHPYYWAAFQLTGAAQ